MPRRSRDAHYTPTWLSELLVAAVRNRNVRNVLDLAAGDGALLRAARARWPGCRLFGIDIRRSARLRDEGSKPQRHARSATLNAVASSALVRLQTWGDAYGEIDVCLLNPPYSSRGGTRYHLATGLFRGVDASRATTFLLRAAESVRVGGTVAAIMPRSFEHSERDFEARAALRLLGSLSFRSSISEVAFRTARATTAIVLFRRLRRRPTAGVHATVVPLVSEQLSGLTLVRGTCPLFQLRPIGARTIAFVHTSSIDAAGAVSPSIARTDLLARQVTGPALILPRVGSFRAPKLGVYRGRGPVTLSDCVVAVTGASLRELEAAERTLRSNWESLYFGRSSGLGAPFWTITTIGDILRRLPIWSRTAYPEVVGMGSRRSLY